MNTFARVQSILCDRLTVSPKDIIGKTDIREELGADSLDMIEVAMDIEDEFGIMVSDEDAESFTTVDSVVQFIERED